MSDRAHMSVCTLLQVLFVLREGENGLRGCLPAANSEKVIVGGECMSSGGISGARFCFAI